MGKAKKRGRPVKSKTDSKAHLLQVRLQAAEKDGFEQAAAMAGLGLSTWVRERLRTIARKELSEYGKTPKFLEK